MCEISIQPGQGGADAENFANSIAASIRAWARRQGTPCRYPDGTRQVSMSLPRVPASQLAWLTGWHRIQHYVPGANKGRTEKRQTSYALVTVIDPRAEVRRAVFRRGDPDVEVLTTRGHGPGGQHRNMTDTAVTVSHAPTGLTVTCQDQRSQGANLDAALTELTSRVTALDQARIAAGQRQERASQAEGPPAAVNHNHFRGEVVLLATGQRWTVQHFAQGRFGTIAGPQQKERATA